MNFFSSSERLYRNGLSKSHRFSMSLTAYILYSQPSISIYESPVQSMLVIRATHSSLRYISTLYQATTVQDVVSLSKQLLGLLPYFSTVRQSSSILISLMSFCETTKGAVFSFGVILSPKEKFSREKKTKRNRKLKTIVFFLVRHFFVVIIGFLV